MTSERILKERENNGYLPQLGDRGEEIHRESYQHPASQVRDMHLLPLLSLNLPKILFPLDERVQKKLIRCFHNQATNSESTLAIISNNSKKYSNSYKCSISFIP